MYALAMPKLAFVADAATPYNCWPNKIRFDSARQQFVMLYNANTSHIAGGGSFIQCRTLGADGQSWSAPITVLDLVASNLYVECNGFVILPNGDYVAYVVTRTGSNTGSAQSCRVMRSQDGGATWTQLGTLRLDGSTIVQPQLVAHAEIANSKIRLLFTSAFGGNTFAVTINPNTPRDYVSSGSVEIDRSAVGNPTYGGEGRFIDLGAGRIIVIARRHIDGIYTTDMRPMYSITLDDGATWSGWQYCPPTATEMTNGNLDAAKNSDGTISLYWSSRRVNTDGRGQIWRSTVTVDELLQGYVGRPDRIVTGTPNRDFGYPGVAQSDDAARRVLVWYDGVEDDTDIFWMDMRKIQDQRNPDYVPGGHVRRITDATRT